MDPPSDQFLRILYWGPQLTFFAYYMGPPSDQFLLIQYRSPFKISFLNCLLYGPSSSEEFILHTIGGPPQISFFAKYMGALSDQFLRLLYGAPQVSFFAYYLGLLISVSVHTFLVPLSDQFVFLTIWGPLRSFLFSILYGAPSDEVLRILYGMVWHGNCLFDKIKNTLKQNSKYIISES